VDGELIGEAGVHRIDHFSRACELGIGIGREFWGKGFGQDAVRTLVDYAFEHPNLNRVGLDVLAEDPRAVGVPQGRVRRGGQDPAARLGARPVRGRARYGDPARGPGAADLVLGVLARAQKVERDVGLVADDP
jgi:Acetyltransferase (GNAT) domain